MLVVVEDSTEMLVSSYIQPGHLAGVGDRRRQRSARSRVRDALVRPMVVIEGLELAQGMEQVPLVPDHGPVEELAAAGQYPPLHDRVHPWHPHTGEHHLD